MKIYGGTNKKVGVYRVHKYAPKNGNRTEIITRILIMNSLYA